MRHYNKSIIWLYACNICINIKDKGDRVLAAKQETRTAWQKVAVAKGTVEQEATHSYAWMHANNKSLHIYKFMKGNYPNNSSRSKPLGFFFPLCVLGQLSKQDFSTLSRLGTLVTSHTEQVKMRPPPHQGQQG